MCMIKHIKLLLILDEIIRQKRNSSVSGVLFFYNIDHIFNNTSENRENINYCKLNITFAPHCMSWDLIDHHVSQVLNQKRRTASVFILFMVLCVERRCLSPLIYSTAVSTLNTHDDGLFFSLVSLMCFSSDGSGELSSGQCDKVVCDGEVCVERDGAERSRVSVYTGVKGKTSDSM